MDRRGYDDGRGYDAGRGYDDDSSGGALLYLIAGGLYFCRKLDLDPGFVLIMAGLLILALFPYGLFFDAFLHPNKRTGPPNFISDVGRKLGRVARIPFFWVKPIGKFFFDVFFQSSQQKAKTKNATFSAQPPLNASSSAQPTNDASSPSSIDAIFDPAKRGFNEPFLIREESAQVNAENWLISLFVSLPLDLAAIVAICRWGGELTEGYGVFSKLVFLFFSVVFTALFSMTLVRVFIRWGKLLRDASTLFPDPILYWRLWGEEEGEVKKDEEDEASGEEEADSHEIVVSRYVQKDDSAREGRLTRVVVPDSIDGCPVTRIADGAFEDSPYLNEVILSDSVTTIGARAFADCPRLDSITLTDSVTSIGADAFSKQTRLVVPSGSYAEEWARKNGATTQTVASKKSASVPKFNAPQAASNAPSAPQAPTPKGNCWGSFYWIENGEDATITGMASTQVAKLKIPSEVAGRKVVEIGARAFQRGAFQSVTFPDDLKAIGFCAFEGCANLKRVDLPRRLKTIDALAFQACRNLTKVSFPNGLEKIEDSAFADCDSLTSIHLPSSLRRIGNAPFSEQTTLTVIAGSYAERWASTQNDCRYRAMGATGRATGATSGKAARRTSSPSSARDSSSAPRNAGNAAVVSNENVFYVPKGYKNSPLNVVGEAVFKGDPTLFEAAIPEGIERVENMAFYECSNLRRAILPDSLRAIGAGAFAECPQLKEVVIPNGVASIARKAFDKDTTLVVAPYSYAQRWADENGIKTRVFDWQERLQEIQILRRAPRK